MIINMKKLFITLTFIVLLFSTSRAVNLTTSRNLFEQNLSDSTKESFNGFDDREKTWEKRKWRSGKSTVAVHFGFSDVNLKNFALPFANPNLIGLKLGFTKRTDLKNYPDVIYQSFKYLSFDYYYDNTSARDAEIGTELITVALGNEKGYGYKLGEASLILYNDNSLNWSRASFQNNLLTLLPDENLSRFDARFRFGSATSAGVKYHINSLLVLDANYQRLIVFPAHLFWQWAGSVIIEGISGALLDRFIDEVVKSSPKAGVIVNFILKNALSYAVYELKQDKTNWPFNSRPPLSFDQFRFGLNFVF